MPFGTMCQLAPLATLCLVASAAITTPAPDPDPFINSNSNLLEPGSYPMVTIKFPCKVTDLTPGQFSAIKQDTFVHLTQVFDFSRDEIEIIDLVTSSDGNIGAAVTFVITMDPILVDSTAEALESSQVITSCGTSIGPGTVTTRTVVATEAPTEPAPTAPPTVATQPVAPSTEAEAPTDPATDPVTETPAERAAGDSSTDHSTDPAPIAKGKKDLKKKKDSKSMKGGTAGTPKKSKKVKKVKKAKKKGNKKGRLSAKLGLESGDEMRVAAAGVASCAALFAVFAVMSVWKNLRYDPKEVHSGKVEQAWPVEYAQSEPKWSQVGYQVPDYPSENSRLISA